MAGNCKRKLVVRLADRALHVIYIVWTRNNRSGFIMLRSTGGQVVLERRINALEACALAVCDVVTDIAKRTGLRA